MLLANLYWRAAEKAADLTDTAIYDRTRGDGDEAFRLADTTTPGCATGRCVSASEAVVIAISRRGTEARTVDLVWGADDTDGHTAVLVGGGTVVDYTMRQFDLAVAWPWTGGVREWTAKVGGPGARIE